MCLRVKQIPQNKTVGLIHECYKKAFSCCGKWYTYIASYPIKDSGWLLPRTQSKITKYHFDTNIDVGHIHYYSDMSNYNEAYYSNYMLEAYSFFNCAYSGNEGICRAMYIPHCDIMNKDETIKKIKRLQQRLDAGTLRTNDVVKAFPFLSDAYEAYKKVKFNR